MSKMAMVIVLWVTVCASLSFTTGTQSPFILRTLQPTCVSLTLVTNYTSYTASNILCTCFDLCSEGHEVHFKLPSDPSWAVDVKNETVPTFIHSDFEDSTPWLLVDLGDTQVRVGDLRSTNGDFSSYTLFSKYSGTYTVEEGRLSCARSDGVNGRFIAIIKTKPAKSVLNNILQILDVNVFVRK